MKNASIQEKHEEFLKNYLKYYIQNGVNLPKEIEPYRNQLQKLHDLCKDNSEEVSIKELLIDKLADAIGKANKERFKKESKEARSFLRIFRSYLENIGGIRYDNCIEIVSHIFETNLYNPRHGGGRFDYLEAVKILQEDLQFYAGSGFLDALAEWRTFFEYRFRQPIKDFFQDSFENIRLTINFSPWSFLYDKPLPVYRTHLNFELETEKADQERDFQKLGKNYSFVWDMVRNNVSSIFYFRKVEKKTSSVAIYEITPDAVDGRGRPRYSGMCIIDPTSNLMDYKKQVINFLIKSGIFVPFDAATKTNEAGDIEYRDLLRESRGRNQEFLEVCKKYQRSSASPRNESAGFERKYDPEPALDEVIEFLLEHQSEQIEKRIETFEAGFLNLLSNTKNFIQHIYWLPIIVNWRNQISGGTVFLNTDKMISGKPSKLIDESARVPTLLITTMYYFMGLIEVNQVKEIERRVRPRTERAAAASIMARNISHNIASHVLSYIKNILGSESIILDNGVLDNIVTKLGKDKWTFNSAILDEVDQTHYAGNKTISLKKLETPYLRALGNLLGYFQERQDYIGIIASGWHHYSGAVNLKETILHPFISNEEKDVGNGKRMKVNNLILDYIIYSEGYDRQKLEFEVKFEMQGTNYQWDVENSPLNNIEVALPSGITGRQAIYSILENFIRNSAKHGLPIKKRKKVKIDITIRENVYRRDYLEVQIESNGGDVDEHVLNNIRNVLSTGLVKEETGTVDEKHKGVKEMQIAAGWLRGIEPFQLNDQQKLEGLPLLTVGKSEGKRGESNLTYTFYLRRSKEVLLIIPNAARGLADKFHSDFEARFNWYVKSIREARLEGKLSYRFILIHESVNNEDVEKIKTLASVRVLQGLSTKDFDNKSKEELLADFFERWLDGKMDQESQVPRFGSPNYSNLKWGRPSTLGIGISDIQGPRESSKGLRFYDFHDVGERALEQPILFRRHNDVDNQFRDFMLLQGGRFYNRALYLEGISGGNSTTRLLRPNSITRLWCMKMREVALTKVLIVDERIWKRNVKPDGEENIIYEKFRKKGIEILSAEIEDSAFVFYDLRNKRVSRIDKTGQLKIEGNEDNKQPEYHFISFHQGLLDKLTDHFKEFPEAFYVKSDQAKANMVFNIFKNQFEVKFRWLIHSGRSKTPILPEGTGFLQLSSLEAALNDSKYTLNELLYSSIIENKQQDG